MAPQGLGIRCSSLPSSWKVVVQDLLFAVAVIPESCSRESVVRRANNNNDRSPTKTLGDDDFFCFLLFCLSSFPKEWPPARLGNPLFVVAVILESCSPGSVVIKQGKIVPLFGLYTQNDRLIYPRTLRAGSLRGACSPLG